MFLKLGVFFGVGEKPEYAHRQIKIDIEKMQYDVSTVATATIDGKDSQRSMSIVLLMTLLSAQLVLDSLVTDYKDIDTQESIKATDRSWKDQRYRWI